MKRFHPFFIFILGGVLFLADLGLKYFAFSHPQVTSYLWKPWLGWEYFENPGVAFGIPLPWFTAFIYTPIILLFLFSYYSKRKNNIFIVAALVFITFGAVSNLIDRIQYHITIDYLRIFTTIINVSDLMIVFGVLLLLYKELKDPPAHP